MEHLRNLLKLLANLEELLKKTLTYLKTLTENRQPGKDFFGQTEETWLDGQDVNQLVHFSDSTLRRLRQAGELPCSRINGKIYYKRSDIMGLLEKYYSGG